MPRLAALCALLLAAAAPPAAAQVAAPVEGGAVYRDAPAEGATLRVVSQDATSLTVEVTADWNAPLADVVGRGGDPAALALRAAAGPLTLTHRVDLMAAVPPPVTVVSFEGEEVRLDAATAEALAGLARPAAEVVGVGRYRRRLVGTLAVAVLRLDGDRLVRTRRAVVRVPRPPVVAAIAAARLSGAGGAAPVTRSVLDEGRWFKVPIDTAGVYRVDAAYLAAELGVENADLARVAVYGNGGRILPAPNAAPRPEDLLEVPSLVRDGALLFYAEGPQWWDWVPETRRDEAHWSHDISPFSEVSYYFLRVDAPAPRRLGAPSPSDAPGAEVLATVADRRFYEVDVTNEIRDGSGSGLDWLGPDLAQNGPGLTVLDVPTPPGVGADTPVAYRARVGGKANPAVTVTASVDGRVRASARPRAVNLGPDNNGDLLTADDMDWTVTGPSSLAVTLAATGGNPGAFAWVDWVEAVFERPATAERGLVAFPTPGGRAGRFEVALRGFAAPPEVWDVTTPDAVRRLGAVAAGGAYRVQVEATDPLRPRELVAFDPAGPSVRTPGGRASGAVAVANQNLRGVTGAPDYVVVTHPLFADQARRLAERRRTRDGLEPVVVTTDQVYNEFASGAPDMRAVRDYMKFLYDRVPADAAPRYLLLFGDGHFDFRNIRSRTPNYVLPYETENMFNRSASYTSDDYFGLLDDDEGDWTDGTVQVLDVGIGRLPVRSVADAQTVVNKIVRYEDPATFGDWRNVFTFVADDQFPNPWDSDLHVLNADVTADRTQAADSSVTLEKIYGPAYPLRRTARGNRRPQMVEDIEQGINRGTLVWNYSGHGSHERLGDEDYLTEDLVDRLDNADRLPVFVTVTCSVGKFDIPDEQSLAEQVLLRAGGGGVAMLTTVRLVYTGANPSDDNNFGLSIRLGQRLVEREPDGRPARLGDALRRTKEDVASSGINSRKFNLLGDPAMRLGLPERRVAVTASPVLTAFERAAVSGRVLGPDGGTDASFSGTADVVVYDAARVVDLPESTCERDRGRCNTDSADPDLRGEYVDQTARIYAGRAAVRGGAFETEFIVPQDVSYSGLPARVVAYVEGAATDGSGVTEGSRVSAEAGTRPDDSEGPEIRLFVGDSTFVDGGEVRPGAPLVARLSDASGINTVGAGVGHELLLTIDGDPSTAVDVGRFYESDLGTFRSGTVRAPLPDDLAPGEHTLTLTAWDALNNPSTAEVRVVVVEEDLAVTNLFPYPNPTAGPTRFGFNHNQSAGTAARAQLRVYTVAGRPVRTIDGDDALPGGRLSGRDVPVLIDWDGLDDDGDRLATGVYLFRLRLEVDDPAGGARAVERVERLAIIR